MQLPAPSISVMRACQGQRPERKASNRPDPPCHPPSRTPRTKASSAAADARAMEADNAALHAELGESVKVAAQRQHQGHVRRELVQVQGAEGL